MSMLGRTSKGSMRKRIVAGAIALLIVIVCLTFLFVARSSDSAKEMVRQQRPGALTTLRQPNERELADLVELLSTANWSRYKWAVWRFTKDHPGLNVNMTPPDQIRAQAVSAFNLLGTNARAAVPAILPLLLREDTSTHASGALKAVGGTAEALSVVQQGSTNQSASVRRSCAILLGDLVSVEPKVITNILGLLKDIDPGVRMCAVHSLKDVPGDATQSALALVERLNDSDSNIRQQATVILSMYGSRASNAVPALLKVWETKTEMEQNLIEGLVLQKIAPDKIPRRPKQNTKQNAKSEYE